MTFRLDNMVEQQQVVKIEVAVPAVVTYADANITDNYANGQMVMWRLAYTENDKKIPCEGIFPRPDVACECRA